MPAIITQQPTANQLTSAYKPVVISCTATTSTGGVPTLVFCDVYINSVYYRTFFSSKADKEGKYIFYIQDVIQENLNYFIPPIDGKKIEITTQTLVDVYVKIRTSKLNESGLNESEQTAPIPGSQETPPIAGEGISSNKFFALNLLIQHEENQDLPSLLKSYQTNQWNNEALPLTRRNQTNFLTNTQSSFFPFISEKRPKTICIDVRLKGQSSFSHYCKALTNDDINEVSNPPTINIKWMNATSSVEDVADKLWDLKLGAFPIIKIKLYPADPDLDIDTVELFQKTGTGAFVSLGLITGPTYDVSGLVVGNYEYKAKITDSKNNTAESNLLKYQVGDSSVIQEVFTEEFHNSGQQYIDAANGAPGVGGQMGDTFTVSSTKKYKISLNFTIALTGNNANNPLYVPVYVRIFKNSSLIEEYAKTEKGNHAENHFENFNEGDEIKVTWYYGMSGFPRVLMSWDNFYFSYD